uniref:Ornithine aminotransferase (Ornithine--oxo-acid aminotransferase) n=1 Tax=mine drainage metagenome TaxID=410659 RepID=E6QKA6_9ZZZZ
MHPAGRIAIGSRQFFPESIQDA